MTTKKERRTPPPTLESIAFKANVKMGTDVEKRDTDTNKKEEPVAAPKKTTKKTKAEKQIWGQDATHQLIAKMIEHKDDQDAFIKSCSGLRSEAKETEKYIYESGPFSPEQIISKAQQVVKRMRSDGYDVALPAKKRDSAIDYAAIYEGLGLKPKKKKRAKK